MKIFYNSVWELNKGWGAETFFIKAFNELGITLYNLDYRKYKRSLYKKYREMLNQRFDWFLLQRGENFPLTILRSIQRPKIYLATELVSRQRDQLRLIKSKLFDHVYVRSEPCRKTVVDMGLIEEKKISVMSSGFDPELFFKKDEIKKKYSVVFVGNLLDRRKKYLENLKASGIDVYITNVYMNELNELYNQSKIVLNIHAEDYLDTETRVYEVLGSGSLLLTEKLSSENPFKNNEHMVEAENFEDMVKKIKYFLVNDEEREQIAAKGNIEANAKYKYSDLANEIVEKFKTIDYELKESSINSNFLNLYKFYEPFLIFKQIISILKSKIMRKIRQ